MKDYNLFNIYLDKDSKSKYNRHFFKLKINYKYFILRIV